MNLNHKIMPSEYVYTTSFKPVGWYVKESGYAQVFSYSSQKHLFLNIYVYKSLKVNDEASINCNPKISFTAISPLSHRGADVLLKMYRNAMSSCDNWGEC